MKLIVTHPFQHVPSELGPGGATEREQDTVKSCLSAQYNSHIFTAARHWELCRRICASPGSCNMVKCSRVGEKKSTCSQVLCIWFQIYSEACRVMCRIWKGQGSLKLLSK